MSQYTCTSCQQTFAHQGGPLRCPSCLRQHGLEPVEQAAARPRRRPRVTLPALIVTGCALLLLAAALLWLRHSQQLPRPGEIGVLLPETLSAALAQRGVAPQLRVNPFAADEPLRELARGVAAKPPQARAEALAAQLAERLRGAQADLLATAKSPLRSPAALWQALAEGDQQAQRPALRLRSYEAAALLVTLLRLAGLPALLGLAQELEGEMTTADVDGLGRYLALLYREGQLDKKPLLLFDPLQALPLPPWAGPGADPQLRARVSRFKPLDDVAAAAHLLALRAWQAVAEEPATAYQLSEAALQAAAAPDALLLQLRARVLASAGGLEDARAEAGKALRLSQSASRLTTLAELQLASGNPRQALPLLEQALGLDRGYWPAHRLLASLRRDNEPDKAHEHLHAALALAPDDPALLVLLAFEQLGRDERQAAIHSLERSLAERVDLPLGLLLYQLLRAEGQDQRGTALRQHLLDQTSTAEERSALEEQLARLDQQAAASQPAAPPPGPPPGRQEPPRLTLPDVSLGH